MSTAKSKTWDGLPPEIKVLVMEHCDSLKDLKSFAQASTKNWTLLEKYLPRITAEIVAQRRGGLKTGWKLPFPELARKFSPDKRWERRARDSIEKNGPQTRWELLSGTGKAAKHETDLYMGKWKDKTEAEMRELVKDVQDARRCKETIKWVLEHSNPPERSWENDVLILSGTADEAFRWCMIERPELTYNLMLRGPNIMWWDKRNDIAEIFLDTLEECAPVFAGAYEESIRATKIAINAYKRLCTDLEMSKYLVRIRLEGCWNKKYALKLQQSQRRRAEIFELKALFEEIFPRPNQMYHMAIESKLHRPRSERTQSEALPKKAQGINVVAGEQGQTGPPRKRARTVGP